MSNIAESNLRAAEARPCGCERAQARGRQQPRPALVDRAALCDRLRRLGSNQDRAGRYPRRHFPYQAPPRPRRTPKRRMLSRSALALLPALALAAAPLGGAGGVRRRLSCRRALDRAADRPRSMPIRSCFPGGVGAVLGSAAGARPRRSGDRRALLRHAERALARGWPIIMRSPAPPSPTAGRWCRPMPICGSRRAAATSSSPPCGAARRPRRAGMPPGDALHAVGDRPAAEAVAAFSERPGGSRPMPAGAAFAARSSPPAGATRCAASPSGAAWAGLIALDLPSLYALAAAQERPPVSVEREGLAACASASTIRSATARQSPPSTPLWPRRGRASRS